MRRDTELRHTSEERRRSRLRRLALGGCNRFSVLAVAQIMARPAVAIAQRLRRPMQRIDTRYDSPFALY
jgi:hypothetical protein